MFFDAECLVIASYSRGYLGSVRAVPKLETDLGGREEEVLAVSELLARARNKELTSQVPFPVKGPGELVKVWVDDEKVSHSKEFYLTLMEDFMKQCRTPAGEYVYIMCCLGDIVYFKLVLTLNVEVVYINAYPTDTE